MEQPIEGAEPARNSESLLGGRWKVHEVHRVHGRVDGLRGTGPLPRSEDFIFGLQPIIEIVTVPSTALFIELVGAAANPILQFSRTEDSARLSRSALLGFHRFPPWKTLRREARLS
jgi:hypothetical protein